MVHNPLVIRKMTLAPPDNCPDATPPTTESGGSPKRRRVAPDGKRSAEAQQRAELRKKLMQEYTTCPSCGISLQLRCLAWRHKCAPTPNQEEEMREELLRSAIAAFHRRQGITTGPLDEWAAEPTEGMPA